MNRITVLAAAGAMGAVVLAAGCSGSTANNSAGSSPGSTTSEASTSAASSVSTSDSEGVAGTGSVTPSGSTPASSPAGTIASSSPSSAPTHSGGSACTTAEMPSGTWRVVPASEGAGHVAADIAFKNVSGHTCTVSGFPGVSLLASNDHPLPTNVLRNSAVAVTTIKVAPGAWVHAEMRYSPNVPGPGEPGTGQCEPMTVHALAQLPGDSAWAPVTLDHPTTVCEKGELQVKPFVGGESSPAGG